MLKSTALPADLLNAEPLLCSRSAQWSMNAPPLSVPLQNICTASAICRHALPPYDPLHCCSYISTIFAVFSGVIGYRFALRKTVSRDPPETPLKCNEYALPVAFLASPNKAAHKYTAIRS